MSLGLSTASPTLWPQQHFPCWSPSTGLQRTWQQAPCGRTSHQKRTPLTTTFQSYLAITFAHSRLGRRRSFFIIPFLSLSLCSTLIDDKSLTTFFHRTRNASATRSSTAFVSSSKQSSPFEMIPPGSSYARSSPTRWRGSPPSWSSLQGRQHLTTTRPSGTNYLSCQVHFEQQFAKILIATNYFLPSSFRAAVC